MMLSDNCETADNGIITGTRQLVKMQLKKTKRILSIELDMLLGMIYGWMHAENPCWSSMTREVTRHKLSSYYFHTLPSGVNIKQISEHPVQLMNATDRNLATHNPMSIRNYVWKENKSLVNSVPLTSVLLSNTSCHQLDTAIFHNCRFRLPK